MSCAPREVHRLTLFNYVYFRSSVSFASYLGSTFYIAHLC